MPKQIRGKTKYEGVYFIEGEGTNGKGERIYYIRYRKKGKLVEEKAGRQYRDAMTPARAALVREQRIEGNQLSNQEKREQKRSEEHQRMLTLDSLWEEYRNSKPDVKSIQTDNYRYQSHVQNILGKKTPDELCPFDFDRLRVKMLKTHSPQSVKHVLGLIKRIINFGVGRQLCPALPFKIEMPSVDNRKTEDLSPAQLQDLIIVLDNHPDIQIANIMRLALYTGMRRGEILELKWSDLDFEHGFINIRDPKGGKAQPIPMNDYARTVLKGHPKTGNFPYVFPDQDGNKRYQVTREMKTIKEAASLPKDFRPLHGLRHVYASLLASSGQVDMYTLQRLLTHKSPIMTQRYAHLRDDTLKRASNLVGGLIEQAMGKGKDSEAEAS